MSSYKQPISLLNVFFFCFVGNLLHKGPIIYRNGHTTLSKADHVIAAPDGEGCPRCGGYVYHADQVFSKGRAWHKGCFKCNKCHRVLDSRIACDGPDNDVYCTGKY